MVVDVIRLIDTNKAKLAFLAPFIVTVLGVVANWVASGEFDTTELRGALSGLVLSLAAGVSAYFAKAGQAVVAQIPDTEVDNGVVE